MHRVDQPIASIRFEMAQQKKKNKKKKKEAKNKNKRTNKQNETNETTTKQKLNISIPFSNSLEIRCSMNIQKRKTLDKMFFFSLTDLRQGN